MQPLGCVVFCLQYTRQTVQCGTLEVFANRFEYVDTSHSRWGEIPVMVSFF